MSFINELGDQNSDFTAGSPIIVPVRWRYKTRTKLVGSGSVISNEHTSTPFGGPENILPRQEETIGSWQLGGTAVQANQVCKYQNPSSFSNNLYVYRDAGGGFYDLVYPSIVQTFTETIVEIDWQYVMDYLRETYSGQFYTLGIVRFSDDSGDDSIHNSPALEIDRLNGYLKDENNDIPVPLFNSNIDISTDNTSGEWGPDGQIMAFPALLDYSIEGLVEGDTINSDAHNVGINTCVSSGQTVPMYAKIYLSLTTSLQPWQPANADIEPPQPEPEPDPDPDPDPFIPVDTSGGSGSANSGVGSSSQGMNSFSSTYGNTRLPFDSIYLTGSNYNSFVSAGGGLISESGVFPNSDSIYIEKIRLSIEGSSMTIIEVVDYDAEPSFEVSEKVYGYVLDDTNTDQPHFCGYVISQKRRLTKDTMEIIYECNDLNFFLSQFYSPSYYIYRPPSLGGTGTVKSYDRVLKEILNVAGITDAIIDLPNYTAPPMNWIYQDLRSILEWTTQYFGKYVYYTDRNGRLNVRATDSLSNIKTYTIGDKSGEISVESFEPMTDLSRSRSRIVLTGDFELTENEFTKVYSLGGEVNPQNNTAQSGIYYFYETITDDLTGRSERVKFYYFIFRPNQTLNTHLLSDDSKSAQVILKSKLFATGTESISDPKELNIRIFRAEPGDSEIYVEDESLKSSAFVQHKIQVRYCTRSDSPIQVSYDTGEFGGVEVIRRPEFKKATQIVVTGANVARGSIDDTPLMRQYLTLIKDFYKPIYGGTLVLDGLDTDLYLLAKVSLTNTNLGTDEKDDLICYAIEYDVPNKRTVVELSNKTFIDLPYFDPIRDRKRDHNELLAKMGLVEELELYKRL